MKRLIVSVFLLLTVLSCDVVVGTDEVLNPEEDNNTEQSVSSSDSNSNGDEEIEELVTILNPTIINSSFENDAIGWDIGNGSYEVSIDSENAYDGDVSLKVSGATQSWGYAVPAITSSVLNNLEENRSYEMSFWVKGDVEYANTYENLDVFFLYGRIQSSISISLTELTDEWQEFSLYFSTGPNNEELQMCFQPNLYTTNMDNWNLPAEYTNHIWIDNILFSELE